MSLIRRAQCNLMAVSILANLSYNKDSLYLKLPVGLLLRSCLMDTIYALYLHNMKAKEAEEEIEVMNKDYVKSLEERFDVYKDKVPDIGLSAEETKSFYDMGCEDTFFQYLTYEMDGEKLKTRAVKTKDLRIAHDARPGNLNIAGMVEYVKTNTKHGRVVNRLNAYYRYFSQYEHFSEQGCGDSLAPFGSDNVSFPLAIDALEAGAIASGLSGTGSAFVAVVSDESIDDVRESWIKYEGRIIETHVDNIGCCLLENNL